VVEAPIPKRLALFSSTSNSSADAPAALFTPVDGESLRDAPNR
jgi:hypothetical protein